MAGMPTRGYLQICVAVSVYEGSSHRLSKAMKSRTNSLRTYRDGPILLFLNRLESESKSEWF